MADKVLTPPAAPAVAPPATDPPAAKSAKGRAAVTLEPSAWECCVPADPTVPRRTVVALTGGDAERAYRESLGVVSFGHPVSTAPADVRERTDAE